MKKIIYKRYEYYINNNFKDHIKLGKYKKKDINNFVKYFYDLHYEKDKIYFISEYLNSLCTTLCAPMLDIYFLCRLFKPSLQIKDAIIYCGGLHTLQILSFLEKEFDIKYTYGTYKKCYNNVNNNNKDTSKLNQCHKIIKGKYNLLFN
jgi:hypothetical protein